MSDPICDVDPLGHCQRHDMRHDGRMLAIATDPGPEGSFYRRKWDEYVPRLKAELAAKPKPAMRPKKKKRLPGRTSPCLYLGPQEIDVAGMKGVKPCKGCAGGVKLKICRCQHPDRPHGLITADFCANECPDYVAKAAPGPSYPAGPRRAVVINLDRRPDRLERFQVAVAGVATELWPGAITRVPAVDGVRQRPPAYWRGGGGAWGCRQSHLEALAHAIRDNVDVLTVFEDDAVFVDGFQEKLAAFLALVPDDWQGLMLGCQPQGQPSPVVVPGVRRILYAQRTHAYVVRGKQAMLDLHAHWTKATTHIDHHFDVWQSARPVYAPDPLLVGQGAGRSDICSRVERERFWA